MDYGEAAKTLAEMSYDNRDLLKEYRLYHEPSWRAPSVWRTQTFAYGFLANTITLQDNNGLVFDGSVVTIANGRPGAAGPVEAPNQLSSTDEGIGAS